jgi:hypothetical protein
LESPILGVPFEKGIFYFKTKVVYLYITKKHKKWIKNLQKRNLKRWSVALCGNMKLWILEELLLDDEEISNVLDELDDIEYLVDNINDYDVNDCKVIYYGVDDERCINALMVVCNKRPLAIGYTED